MSPARATHGPSRLLLLVLSPLLACALMVACGKAPPASPATTAAPASSAPTRQIAATTCDLITQEELRTIFPGAVNSRPQEHVAFGVASCEWNGDFGRLLIQQWASKGHTPQDEVRALVSGFIDQNRPGAAQRIRLVSPRGLGHYATAVVEARDLPGGVLSDLSVLSIARDGKTLVFLTDALDEHQREVALDKLTRLGRYAYARL